MNKYKNKMTYDVNTGRMVDSRHIKTMLEDIWLPRRDGSRGTEVSSLQGGQNLGEVEDIEYFKKKLYRAMGVPMTRLSEESTFNMGRSNEITRDEIKFSRFITRLRYQFNKMLIGMLKTQVKLKGVMTGEEFDEIQENIFFNYSEDMIFAEMKQMEILESRLSLMRDMREYVGQYFSHDYVAKRVFQMSEEDYVEQKKKIAEEKSAGEHEEDENSGGF